MSFRDFHDTLRSNQSKGTNARNTPKAPDTPFNASLLSFDPGQTTGWVYFEGTTLVKAGQLKTRDLEEGIQAVSELIREYMPDEIVLEDYRVYSWKAKEHSFSELHTPKLIGSMYAIAHALGIPVTKQPAHIAKRFCTDKKLQQWGFYISGQRHARDAIRHACYYILFGSIQGKHK